MKWKYFSNLVASNQIRILITPFQLICRGTKFHLMLKQCESVFTIELRFDLTKRRSASGVPKMLCLLLQAENIRQPIQR